jgi:hypothetical protein
MTYILDQGEDCKRPQHIIVVCNKSYRTGPADVQLDRVEHQGVQVRLSHTHTLSLSHTHTHTPLYTHTLTP